jgi:hypothetical protein
MRQCAVMDGDGLGDLQESDPLQPASPWVRDSSL